VEKNETDKCPKKLAFDFGWVLLILTLGINLGIASNLHCHNLLAVSDLLQAI
jgi:hypothetical protein